MLDQIKAAVKGSDSIVGDLAGAASLVVMLVTFLHLPLFN